MHVFNILN